MTPSFELPHDLLVSALEGLVSCLDEPCFKKSPGDGTLKLSFVSGLQTTHFHQDSRIRQHRPKNCRTKPIPPSDGDIRLPNRSVVDLEGCEPQRFPSHLIPISTESATSDENAQGTIATSLSLPRKETIVCQFKVDRTFLRRTIPAISTGVIQSFFAPAL